MKNLSQLNVRIDAAVRKAHKLATEVADESLEEMTEAALRYFYGSKDVEVIEKRKKALAAVASLANGQELPFNAPWPPTNSNALTAAA